VVEIFSQCPTYFGRKNKLGGAVDMLKLFKEMTVPVGSEKKKDNPALFERGIFVDKDLPEYCQAYDQVIARAQQR
jgi:2-oxoglutarate ferredoxin oxidoreductase subunit beta